MRNQEDCWQKLSSWEADTRSRKEPQAGGRRKEDSVYQEPEDPAGAALGRETTEGEGQTFS